MGLRSMVSAAHNAFRSLQILATRSLLSLLACSDSYVPFLQMDVVRQIEDDVIHLSEARVE